MVRKRASERVEAREAGAVDTSLCAPLLASRASAKGDATATSVEVQLLPSCTVDVELGDAVTADSLRPIGTVVRELAKEAVKLSRLRAKHAAGDWRDAAVGRHGVVARLGGAAWDAVLPALDEEHMRPAWSRASIDALARAVANRWSKVSATKALA